MVQLFLMENLLRRVSTTILLTMVRLLMDSIIDIFWDRLLLEITYSLSQ